MNDLSITLIIGKLDYVTIQLSESNIAIIQT